MRESTPGRNEKNTPSSSGAPDTMAPPIHSPFLSTLPSSWTSFAVSGSPKRL